MARVEIPYAPRRVFLPYHNRRQRWSILVAHRRAGKTVATINDLIKRALECKKDEPRFAYIAPTYGQAKDVAWSYLKRFAAPLPGLVIMESELSVTLPNGARVRLYGADNYDRLRGLYLDGIVLDEFADMDPRTWSEVVRPALSDRQGWATFIGTPKGRNTFHKLWIEAQTDDGWFPLMLRASETGILPAEELRDAARAMTPDQYAQEYECSFQAAVQGSYYGRDMEAAEKEGRICSVPYDRAASVFVSWDLGASGATVLWFAQVVGREVHLVDYYTNQGFGLDHYVQVVRERGYPVEQHILPHDAAAREIGTGKTREETLRSLGLNNYRILPAQSVEDGINAVRMSLNRCWFDKTKCAAGIEALRVYRTDYDEKRQVFKSHPLHDWASHAADSFRYLMLGKVERKAPAWKKPEQGWVV